MIKTFRSKELAALWEGKRTRIDGRFQSRILVRLDALDGVVDVALLNLPGYELHALRGHIPTRYTIHVNGPWCITFEFSEVDAYRVDFEQYH